MSDDIRTGSHVTEESTNGLQEAIQGLEQAKIGNMALPRLEVIYDKTRNSHRW